MRATAGLIAASAWSASALVIPASPAAQLHVDPRTSPLNPKRHSIQLPCASCLFPSFADKIESDTTRLPEEPQDVVLDFSISQNGEHLLLNGETIFRAFADRRIASHVLDAEDAIYIEQVSPSAPWDGIRAGDVQSVPLRVTRSELIVQDVRPLSLSGDALIPLKYIIHELEDQPSEVDDVELVLLRTSDGELLIMQMRNAADPTLPFLPPPAPEEDHAEETPSLDRPCPNLPAPLCHFKNIIASKLSSAPRRFGAGGCHRSTGFGRLPGHIKPSHFLDPDREDHSHDDDDSSPQPIRFGNAHRHGHHHGHHRNRHSILRSLTHVLAAVLVPTLAGIAMGITVSIFGLFVGRVFAALWQRFVRPNAPAANSSRASTRRTASPCESLYDVKHVIVEEDESDDEALPGYEDAPAPAYEEVEKK